MKILLSTSNTGKVKELKSILGDDYDLLLKSDFNLRDFDVEEDGKTLKENAYKKAKSLHDKVNININVIADDTGLFVKSLNGAPGIYSARYAGEEGDYSANNKKLLKELENKKDRSAYFETVICLITESGDVYYASGRLEGYIANDLKGEGGFGYDPLFIFDKNKSLAEISAEEKNKISHRSKALENLRVLLEKIKKD